jgi:rare lipoprotein A (peptidoglycan hydrolase)
VNTQLAERQILLAAVALVATLGTLGLHRAGVEAEQPLDPPPPAAAAWREAAAGTFGPGFYGATTTCDVLLDRQTQGVAHPGLPCGARMVVSHEGREVETRVVDRATYGSDQEIALTQALADQLGVTGVETVRWRFSSG